MRILSKNIQDLTSALAKQLLHARESYACALGIAGAPAPEGALLPLLDASTYSHGDIEVTPYEPVVPGVSFGFEVVDDFSVSLRPVPSWLADEAIDCEIEVRGAGASAWLTLELELDFQFLRQAHYGSLSVFGSQSVSTEHWDQSGCGVQIFFFGVDGERLEMLPELVPLVLPEEFGQVRADFKVSVPTEPRVDFDRPAILCIFFPPHAKKIQLTDLSILFS